MIVWHDDASAFPTVHVTRAAKAERLGAYTTAPTAGSDPPEGEPVPWTPAGSMNARTVGNSFATRSLFG